MASLIKNIVIVGGGTSGWMAASLLSKTLGKHNFNITLVESDEIGTVGVGEATIPPINLFNQVLGIDENDFIRKTNATFKLGIHFVNWQKPGTDYFHPFGTFGTDMDGIGFNSYLIRLMSMGGSKDYGRFNLETMAARDNRFGTKLSPNEMGYQGLNYAFQFDARLYAAYLRQYSEMRGVTRIEGKVIKVDQKAESGFITQLTLDNGKVISGDLFIDCSGFKGLLIEETLKTGYEDWSQWLPCDRAVAVPCARATQILATGEDVLAPITPYTRSTAQEAGWQWRIPLQHRTGNGYVFCSQFISEDEASNKLMSRLDAKPEADPKVLRFKTGHRKKIWNKNVLSLGLSSGFLEPLESTSIHLVQICLTRFISMMPRREFNQKVIDEYNRLMTNEYINVKDFLIAHYKVTEREDTPFWQYCRHMEIPDSLKSRLEIFANQSHANVSMTELFKEASWLAVLLGQGFIPRDYSPVADVISTDELRLRMAKIRTNINNSIKGLPPHDKYIADHCSAR